MIKDLIRHRDTYHSTRKEVLEKITPIAHRIRVEVAKRFPGEYEAEWAKRCGLIDIVIDSESIEIEYGRDLPWGGGYDADFFLEDVKDDIFTPEGEHATLMRVCNRYIDEDIENKQREEAEKIRRIAQLEQELLTLKGETK